MCTYPLPCPKPLNIIIDTENNVHGEDEPNTGHLNILGPFYLLIYYDFWYSVITTSEVTQCGPTVHYRTYPLLTL